MASSPFYMLWYFLALASTAWVLFNFTARALSRLLGKILKAKVQFRFAGFLRLKDISIHFTKGPLASVAVREISLKLPLTVLNFSALRESKLQLCASEVEVLLQKSGKSRQRIVSQQKTRERTKLPGQSKAWPIIANCAKHVNLTVTDLGLKAVGLPNLSVQIGDLDLDTFRSEETTLDSLGVRLGIAPVNIHVRERQPYYHDTDVLESGIMPEKRHILFSLGHFSLISNLEYVKDRGLIIHHVEVDCGEAEVSLGEEMLVGDNSLVRSLLRKKADGKDENGFVTPNEEGQDLEVQSVVEKPEGTRGKGLAVLPEKFGFNLPVVSFNCTQLGGGATLKSKINGICIRSCVSKPADQAVEIATVCEMHFDCGEIHILEEIGGSLFEIFRVSVVATVELYPMVNSRQRVEIDANLEGTRCNLYQNGVDDLLKFVLRLPRNTSKAERAIDQSTTSSKKKKSKSKLCWVCTISAPEMGVTAYDRVGRPVFTVSSQSLQFFVDNVSGPACRMQLEVGELQMMMIDDLNGELTLSGECKASCFIRLGGLVMEWGTSEHRIEDDKARSCSVIILECSQIGIYLSVTRLQALLTLALGAKEYMKNVLSQRPKATSKSSVTSKSKKRGGWRKIEFGVQGLIIQFCGPALVDEGEVVDPKTLNFGDQGGRVVKTHNHDGVLRTASIKSSGSHGYKDSSVLCKATFEKVFGLVSIDDHKNLQFFLDHGQVSHEQVGFSDKVISKHTMFAVQNFEVLYEGGSRETGSPGRLLLSVTNVDGYWDPDLHSFYYDVALQLQVISSGVRGKSKDEGAISSPEKQDSAVKKKVVAGKQKLRLAVDLEKLNFSAQITKEIDFAVRVQSLVSEDVEIGLLVENIHAACNDCQVLHVEQAQICRLPSSTPDSVTVTGQNGTAQKVDWNISIHATKIRTILPFRLQLRVIDDATEDMWRVLKLVMRDQKNKRKPMSSAGDQRKTKKPSAGIQSILVSVHELSFEIEEEPLQGWLDEHYHLMGREVCKLQAQERILEEKRQEAVNSPTSLHSTSTQEFDLEWERIQKKAFNAYQSACENLVLQKGSGACRSGRQAGFRVSSNRMALLLVRASNVEMNLSRVAGSMVEAIRKLDCVSPDMQVPYSKVYGRHLSIQASTLVAQLRDFPSPLVRARLIECEGNVIVAQQATIFPQQMRQEVNLGTLRIVEVWRSISGATPAYKTFFDLDLQVDSGDFSYGVGYEPVIADVSYAFSIALQKAKPAIPVVKKERSLPWWDDMRYYIHGRNSLKVNNFTWSLLATTNPYEDQQMLQFVATTMDITQSEGSVVLRADDFEWVISRCSSSCLSNALSEYQEKLSVLHTPQFKLEILMDWKCESGMPLNHYLHPFPNDPNPPTKKYDLFRSISLSLTFSFSLFCPAVSKWNPNSALSKSEHFAASKGKFRAKRSSEKFLASYSLGRTASHHSEMPSDALHIPVPTIYFGSQELKWIFRLWNLFYSPPHKLRSFSKWPRFGIKRVPRSGNLSLDKVMTEYLLRVDATPGCIKHRSNLDADPAHGLTFRMKRLRYELLYSRCQSHCESTGPREPLISVYQGLDLSMLNARLDTVAVPTVRHQDLVGEIDKGDKVKELLGLQEGLTGESNNDATASKQESGKGFLLSMDCFTLRKQAPKAGLSLLSALLHYKRITRSDGSATLASEGATGESGSDLSHSDASDDEGFNVVLADNCLRVSVYGLKLLWTLPNRDAVWSWVEDFSRAFQSSKPSPSRQYAQRKVLEMKEKWVGEKSDQVSHGLKEQPVDTSEEEGVMHFMVNVVQPQFNLHSEDAHGRLLLAAASGRVLARSFHSIVAVGLEIIAHALRKEGVPSGPQGGAPVIAWKRRELSVILEHVQAHVAPTDVDLGAGLQWLPKIPTGGAPKVRRTGALLERVFMPCSMYFQYTRHKGGTTDCKVKPLKELSFNSPNITATMTSNQFHIMVDVISNLLLARLPKPRKKPSLQYVGDENSTDEGEEEVDEVVPEGVEEVELARIKLEQAERDCRAVMWHWALMKRLGFGTQSAEIQMLERHFTTMRVERRSAFVTLRDTLQSAAQQRLMEKEKHRTPLAAMRISWAIDKFVWSMLCDGESFAEAEISSMILNVDREFNDIGVARFTTKWFAVKNCLPGAKSDTVLSPWNPPAEWGRNVMLRVDAKQGAPEDGHSPLELFQVEIYPLKIYLTEGMYTMMWDYLFPEEDHDLVQRQTIRIQHQKVSLSIGNASTAKEGRNASFSKSVEEREVEVSTDEVSSKATVMRLSNSCHEDLHSTATIHSTTSIETTVKSKEQKTKKGSKLSIQEEKKITEDKKAIHLQKKLLEFHNIRISQVELLVTYEGSRFSVTDMRLLMDTFTRLEFTGSWRRLFSKVKKHIIWSVLKSVTGMQGKKFKDKLPAQNQADGGEGVNDSNSSDSSTSQTGHEDQFPIARFRKHSDRAGEGFVSSIRGLFNSQRRKAKALVMRKLSIDLRNSTETFGYLSGADADSATSPQDIGNLIKAKRLLRRHSRKLRSSGSQKGGTFDLQSQSSSSSSPVHAEAELSDGSSAYEDFHELG